MVGKELGATVGGVVGMEIVAATALSLPSIGQVVGVGLGAAAILFGAMAGSAISKHPGATRPLRNSRMTRIPRIENSSAKFGSRDVV
jgi:hypothetical protein